MSTKKKIKPKSATMEFLDDLIGEPMTLGNLLESIRLCEELPQTEFAKRLGISKSYLCDIEKGRKFVSAKKAQEYAKVLGYSIAQFVRLALQDEIARLGMNKFKVHLELKRVA